MKKIIALTLAGAFLAAPAMAGSMGATHDNNGAVYSNKSITADERAKLSKQQQNLRVNRAEKEAAIANGNPIDQASQSVQIGANKTAIKALEGRQRVDNSVSGYDAKKRLSEIN